MTLQTRQATLYITSDGTEYVNDGEAEEHEFKHQLVQLLESSNGVCSTGNDREEIMTFISANRKKLWDLLNSCDLGGGL